MLSRCEYNKYTLQYVLACAELKHIKSNTRSKIDESDDDVSDMDQSECVLQEDSDDASDDDLEAMIKAKSLQSDDELSSS